MHLSSEQQPFGGWNNSHIPPENTALFCPSRDSEVIIGFLEFGFWNHRLLEIPSLFKAFFSDV